MKPTKIAKSRRANQLIDVQYATRSRRIPTERQIRSWVEAALGARRSGVELTVRVVDRSEALELNRRWRGVSRPTNVLAFPAHGLEEVAPALLGDIVVCAPVINAEARSQGKTADAHWAHVIVHGTLHLLGFDHETPQQARQMEAVEAGILGAMDYPDPYGVPAQ